MDVHPPHHPILTWRDFFIHIATITIGLLIAIALEQAVEALHHRHIVHIARENIRRELGGNQVQSRQNLVSIQTDADNMNANIVKARALRKDRHALDGRQMTLAFSWSSFNEAAWESARESGALTYMPPEEVQRFADVYHQQELVDREAISIFTSQSEVATPFVMEEKSSDLQPEDIHAFMHNSALSLLRLNSLHQIIQQLASQYASTLKD